MVILDLFSGAGGFSLGFQQVFPGARFVAVDIDPVCCGTYSDNIKNSTVINGDVLDIDPGRFGDVDILIGSPPCQPFSIANRFASHDTALVERFLEARDVLDPAWWVMEEVPLVGRFGLMEPRYLEARDFGLPHRRKRLFAGNYPPALGFDRWRGPLVKTPVAKMRGYYHGKEDRKRVVAAFGELLSWLEERGEGGDVVQLMKAAGGEYGKLVAPRVMAWVMGFPASFAFRGNKKQVYRQVGNAVCPPVARAIAASIKRGNGAFKPW